MWVWFAISSPPDFNQGTNSFLCLLLSLSRFLDRHFGFLFDNLTTRSQTSLPRSPLPAPRFSNILLLVTIIFLAAGCLCYHNKWIRRRRANRGMFFYAFHWYIVRHDFAHVIILCVQRSSLAYEMILRSLDLLLRKNCEWKNFSEIILHKYYKWIRRVS